MKQALDNFHSNKADIGTLLNFAQTQPVTEQKVFFRSAVVLLIAAWEQFIELLADNSITVLTNRLRDSSTLPSNVKQEIAKYHVPEKRNNPQDFSTSVWSFADMGWKSSYISYCRYLTSSLNTASSNHVRQLYSNLLGIRDVTENWRFQETLNARCSSALDDLVNLRHDIAHGTNIRVDELTSDNLERQLEFITSLAENTYETILNCIANLSQTQAIEYSLAQSCFKRIIDFAYSRDTESLSLSEIRSLGSSAQGNHRKLCYEPWLLLERANNSTMKINNRLISFHDDRITLPLQILVFDNNESIAKPGTTNIYYSAIFSETDHG
jgi:hypothetical protein